MVWKILKTVEISVGILSYEADEEARGWRYYRNWSGIDDSWVPGIGIGIESYPPLESVSESVSILAHPWNRNRYRFSELVYQVLKKSITVQKV